MPAVDVATRARPAHLEILARHVHADEVPRSTVGDKLRVQVARGLLRRFRCREPPERQELTLVRLDGQYTLFAATDHIALGMLAVVDVDLARAQPNGSARLGDVDWPAALVRVDKSTALQRRGDFTHPWHQRPPVLCQLACDFRRTRRCRAALAEQLEQRVLDVAHEEV